MMYVVICSLPVFFIFANGQNVENSSFKLIPPTDCGTTRFDHGPVRIVGGTVAALGQFPWIARIGLLRKWNVFFFCGGSLISRYYVITAAHCKKSQGNIVRLGENDIVSDIDCENGVCAPPVQDIRIKKFMIHNKYCTITHVHDYGLIELVEPAQFNDFVRPICFPSAAVSHQDLREDDLTASGWGLIKSRPPLFSRHLLYVSIPVLDNNVCGSLFRLKLLDSQICLGDRTGKNSCNGDSGGPAARTIVENGKRRVYLVGVVSYGTAICGRYPVVYTDASRFVSWTSERLIKK